MSELTNVEFNFELHKQKSVTEYTKVKPLYEAFSITIQTILKKCLEEKNIKYHSIEARAKSIESFAIKASKPSKDNINEPKYKSPLSEITDLAAVRIITFFPITINEVDEVLLNEFNIIEKSDKSELLDKEEKLGYQSVHYLIKLKSSRCNLSEYKIFNEMVAEIQVRTILQHAWAEIEHDIEYKSTTIIPATIKRRFMALAGLLEIADREFQSIQNDNETIKTQSRISVNSGRFQSVEITPDSLKTYLDKKFGTDGRMSDFSYDFEARLLIKLGFKDLKQVDDCIKDYDDNKISKLIWGIRQGQISRFDDLLLVGMGENFINKHPWADVEQGANSDFWVKLWGKRLLRLREAEVAIGDFNPESKDEL